MSVAPGAPAPNSHLDVAIIGGGCAGVYAGWRLVGAPAGGRLRVGLFEMSDRIGGRLWTVRLPDLPHVPAETGGMRYLNEHKIVATLIPRLGLTEQPFPMGGDNNFAYLRGVRFRDKDYVSNPDTVPYRLAPDERGKSPDDLLNYAIEKVAGAACVKWDRQYWEETWLPGVRYTRPPVWPAPGAPMQQIGFWNLLWDILSNEGYKLVMDGGGYDSNVINWNAGMALPYVMADFSSHPAYFKVQEGYSAFPERLADEFVKGGGGLYMSQRLLGFSQAANGVVLNMWDGATQQAYQVTAGHLVLALPTRSLELIDQDNFFFGSDGVQTTMPSVIKQPAFKIFLAYREPWWQQQLGLTTGHSITDLPMRQVYYFGTEADHGGDPKDTNALLMAAYCDMTSTEYWKYLGPPGPLAPQYRHDPGPQMIDVIQQQLRDVHGLRDIPDPYAGVFRDWSMDPYGAGFHAWRPNFDVPAVMKTIRKPLVTAPVYVCGEAYSDGQGWVEGALRTAELMLEEHFGLSRPGWLDAKYYLGP